MLKLIRPPPQWTCASCCRRQIVRQNSSVAAAAFPRDQQHFDAAYLNGATDTQANNQLLRDVFNNRAFWHDFSSRAKTTTGLVGNRHLSTPRGFRRFAESSLRKCKRLVDRTLSASSVEEYQRIPRDLDRLSDLLCRVIDLSDFIRSIHPDQEIVAAATASYSVMFQYMNELNTTTGLNLQLKKALNIPEVCSKLTREEKMVSQILMKDFAKSGIDLPQEQREKFVSMSNDIAAVGTDFVNTMEYASEFITARKDQLTGIDPTFTQKLAVWDKTRIPVYSPGAKLILNAAHDPSIRRSLYVAERTASQSTITKLESLLLHRARLAKLTGHETFGHMTLTDKMSKRPDAAMKFLNALNRNNKSQTLNEIDALLKIKQASDSNSTQIEAWEHPYLLNQLSRIQLTGSPRTSGSRLRESRNAFFALGHVIQGLSSLFESLYGVRLVPKETQIGETWHPDVRRLDVFTESDQHIATMYCDLFSRPGKLPNPAHFTLLCSREISSEEVEEAAQNLEPLNDGMPTYAVIDPTTGNSSYHQTPIISLVCDFPDTKNSMEPSLLSPHAVTTLFHEMGHAVHSILGRTTMQGIAGTRCATDFAELPSVLMEYFATNATVLKLFARHWQTGQLIPDEMIEGMTKEQRQRAERSGGWENESQILMAMLDQVYHSHGPVAGLETGRYDSTAEYHRIWNQYCSAQEPASTSWQGFFGHLYGYGATYYSYLFDRAIARQVWRAVFEDGDNGAAISRDAGQRFKDEVLKWGGGRDPWLCLEGLLGHGQGILAEGGDEAMDLVGTWGIDAGDDGMA